MIAKDLRNSNKGETLRLPEAPGKDKHRRYLIEGVVHSHGGYVRVQVANTRAPWPLTLADNTPVEVTP